MYERTEINRPTGINKDLSMYELPPEIWSDGSNVDFRRARTNKATGFNNPFEVTDSLIGPEYIIYWTDNIDNYWIYADNSTIQATDGVTISVLGTGYLATRNNRWSGVNFNGTIIMANPNDVPQTIDQEDLAIPGPMIDLPNWGTQAADSGVPPIDYNWGEASRTRILRGYKNFIMALDNWDDTGKRYPAMVRWSSNTTLGDVPPSWDPYSPSEQAGFNTLGDTPGKIVDGLTLGDYFIVYKTDAVHAVQFVGGEFAMSFRKIFGDEAGCLTQDCVVEFDGQHFVLSTIGAYVHNASSKQEVMEPWIRDELFFGANRVAAERIGEVRVVADHTQHEIWIYYTSQTAYDRDNDSYADRLIIWNWIEKKWAIRNLAPTLTNIARISYAAEGPIDQFDVGVDSWDSDDQAWDLDDTVWDDAESGIVNAPSILLGDSAAKIFYGSDRGYDYAGVPVLSFVERKGIDMGSDEVYKYITRLVPHFLPDVPASGEITVKIYTEDSPTGNPTLQGTYTFDPATDWSVDFHHQGRYVGLRFETYSNFTLTGYSLVWEPSGQF